MKKIILVIPLMFFFAFSVFAESGGSEFDLFRDEELARKYSIIIVQHDSIPAKPEKLLFRMAGSEDEKTIKIAYHVVWPFEKDIRKGFWPWWTRVTYTGGLKLQKMIYGPGDVEAIELTLDAETGKVIGVKYETADWDKKGRVIHVPVVKSGGEIPSDEHLAFRIVSWNHMFELIAESEIKKDEPRYKFYPEYFSEELWSYYRMTKKKQTPLKRDRAHFEWEVN
jgi:hypothetical protein